MGRIGLHAMRLEKLTTYRTFSRAFFFFFFENLLGRHAASHQPKALSSFMEFAQLNNVSMDATTPFPSTSIHPRSPGYSRMEKPPYEGLELGNETSRPQSGSGRGCQA